MQWIARHTRLRDLYLQNCLEAPPQWTQLTALTSLSFGSCASADRPMELPAAITRLTTLQHLGERKYVLSILLKPLCPRPPVGKLYTQPDVILSTHGHGCSAECHNTPVAGDFSLLRCLGCGRFSLL